MDPIKADLPYPEVKVTEKNSRDAWLLMNDYAGRQSETTAIFNYSYQSYIFDEKYPEIAQTLERIGIAEMFHHELLGSTIVKLGGQPIIAGQRGFWNGSFVNYEGNIRKALMDDIREEQTAIANYRNTIRQLNNQSVIALIERIILDEEVHIVTLNQLLKSLE
jgi:bacterioferritin